MNLRQLLPRGISQDTFQMLSPVLEAEALRKQQKYEEAEARYLEALKDFPAGSGGRFLIFNKMGVLYEEIQESERALEMYKRAVEEGAVTPFTYRRLASLCMAAGSLSEARGYCNGGIKVLRRANTTLFQEAYFWIIFQGLKRKIRIAQAHLKR